MNLERPSPRLIALVLLVLLILLAATGAFAQPANDEKYLGLGLRVRPAYEGAESSLVDAIPYVRLYGESCFARTTQGILETGWRSPPLGGVVLGAQLAYEEGRSASDSPFLQAHNPGDLNPSVSLGLHAERDWKIGALPLNALVRYRHDLNPDNGAQADLRVTAGILDWHGWLAGLYGQLTWGDAAAMQRSFGITPAQSAQSGLAPYQAGSGMRSFRIGLLGEVDLARHWIALWGVSLQQLQGDARHSPIVREPANWYANAGVAYRF
jgi:MipA family protein